MKSPQKKISKIYNPTFIKLFFILFISTNFLSSLIANNHIEIYQIKTENFNLENIDNQINIEYVRNDIYVNSNKFTWFKIGLNKKHNDFLSLKLPGLLHVEAYISEKGKIKRIYNYSLDSTYYSLYPVIDLSVIPNQINSVFLKIKSYRSTVLPFEIEKLSQLKKNNKKLNIFTSIYMGILLTMILFNIFLGFSLKDKSFFFFILMLISLGLSHCEATGYMYILYNHLNWFGFQKISFYVISILNGITTLSFVIFFFNTRENYKILNKIFVSFIIIYFTCTILVYIGFENLTLKIISLIGISSFLLPYLGFKAYKNGFRPSLYFVIAWFFSFIPLTLFFLKESGVIPYFEFINYSLIIGSALQTIFTTMALTDKVNVLKQEKDKAIIDKLEQIEENRSLIENQNKTLETEVKKRTEDLEIAYTELKRTQKSQIEAEKMSSLGVLTAGIAHELNNPINFIANNVSPLKRDLGEILTLVDKYETCIENIPENEHMEDLNQYKEEIEIDYLKKEIDILLNGIHEGSNRTAEIVHHLKVYSHLDSGAMRSADIVPGLISTIGIMQSNFKIDCKIQVDIPDNISEIVCLPGKLNQVFMNILNNAIHASMEKNKLFAQRHVSVSCYEDADKLYVSFKDNGNGIPPKVLERIFDPFFTTKKVGLGTGLGLSISKTIIENHHGEIKINTIIGKGTEFIVILPRKLPKKNNAI